MAYKKHTIININGFIILSTNIKIFTQLLFLNIRYDLIHGKYIALISDGN